MSIKSGENRGKQKEKTIRREFSAGGLVFKRKSKEVLWLITNSSPSSLYPEPYWRLPKGWLDDSLNGKSPGPYALGVRKPTPGIVENAAIREVQEEGGVNAKILKKVGTEKRFFVKEGKGVLKFITYYLMEYISDNPSGFGYETSEVGWFTYDEARKNLKYPSEKKVLDEAKRILDSGLQENLI